MKAVLLGFLAMLPLIFGVGFIAPLIAQSLDIMTWSRELGLPNLAIGLVIGGVWGAITCKTGRWI